MDEQVLRVTVARPRDPMPAESLPTLRGRVVALVDAAGVWTYGYVAYGDVYTHEGHPFVDVVPARAFWEHELLGAQVVPLAWPAGCVFAL